MADIFYSSEELKTFGLTRVGDNVRIRRNVLFYKLSGSIGDNVRIDDYCVITGHIELGRYIHIAPFCLLIGTGATITMHDGSGLSSHCSLYTASDDYKNANLSNPTVSNEHKKVTTGPVILGAGVIIGSHSVILPNVSIGDGASIGAQALVYRNIPEGAVCASTTRKMEITGQRDAAAIKTMISKLK